MSDDYYRRQFFVTDEDQDLWNRYQSRSRHRYIPLLKIALLREWQAELATSRNANEKSRNIEDLHEYRELKTQMKEASCCLRIHKKIVREELKEARGGSVNENLKLDLRNINIEEEMKTLWSIPQAMMEHKHLKEVIESWKKSNDTMLVALVDGRPIYRKEDIEGM